MTTLLSSPAELDAVFQAGSSKRCPAKVGMSRDIDIINGIFEDFDTDGSGSISKEELAETLNLLNPDFWDEAKIDALFCAADCDADGEIDYHEFVEWLVSGDKSTQDLNSIRVGNAVARATRLNGQQINQLLESYTPDKQLTKAEFITLFQRLGIATEAAEDWFRAVDVNGNNLVEFQELMTALVVCSAEDDLDETASMLMKVHDTNGSGFLDSTEFVDAFRKAVNVMKATFYPALMEILHTETNSEGNTWAHVFIMNERSRNDTKKNRKKSDDELLEIALREKIYPESIFDDLLDGISELFALIDLDSNGKVCLEEFTQALGTSAELHQIMFPQHAVGAMVQSYIQQYRQ